MLNDCAHPIYYLQKIFFIALMYFGHWNKLKQKEVKRKEKNIKKTDTNVMEEASECFILKSFQMKLNKYSVFDNKIESTEKIFDFNAF